ncbi:MAG: tandem-95 repeat protein [Anaerolineaceae bacterium]|nr:tandem-95 repeat protein [Anaerolineaceae bacterium]
MPLGRKILVICLLLLIALLPVSGPTAAQSNSIDNVVVSVPVCDSPNGSSDGRLAVTFTIDGLDNRWISNTLSGISNNTYPSYGAGTHTENYQYFAPPGTMAGSILTVTVQLGTQPNSSDLDSETFSFNCSTGEKVGTPVAPFATGDSAITPYQTAVTINVLLNDTDSDGNLNPASTAVVSDPANGSVTNNNDGTFVYTPNNGFSGIDSFTYQVCDTTNLCSAAAPVTIQVSPPNRPPVANDDSANTATNAAVNIQVSSNDSDPDDVTIFNPDTHTFSVISNPSNGVAVYRSGGLFTYTPNAGFNGIDSFTYQLCDSGGLCASAKVTIQVGPIFSSPVAIDDSFRIEEGVGNTLNVALNDSDPDGDLNPESVTALTNPSNGTLFPHSDGTFSYKANDGFLGFDSFTYQICDFGNHCASANVTIEVFHVDHQPIATDLHAVSDENGVDFGLTNLISDADGNLDLKSLTILNSPTNGTLTATGEGMYRYVPTGGFVGQEILTYRICDTTNLCATASITIDVKATNRPPVANDDEDSTIPGFDIGIDVAGNDTDPDGNLDLKSITILTNPTHGTASRLDTFVHYIPDNTYVGSDSFSYQICDTEGLCDSAKVTVAIMSPGSPPVANDDTATTPSGSAVVINVITNDNDPDGNLNPNSISVLTNPANGTLFNNGNGSFIYTPNKGFSGTDSFTYQICDTNKLCASAKVTISVSAIVSNHAPDCSGARPTIRVIWPPINLLIIPVRIRGITDADHDRVEVTITNIMQNEANRGLFRGDLYPDSFGIGTQTAWLRAERNPKGTGRIYTIAFSANDGKGGSCTGMVIVTVPRK